MSLRKKFVCGFKFKENENKPNIKKHVDACQSTNVQTTRSNITNFFASSSSKSDRRLNFFTPRVPSTGKNKADSRSDSGTSSTHGVRRTDESIEVELMEDSDNGHLAAAARGDVIAVEGVADTEIAGVEIVNKEEGYCFPVKTFIESIHLQFILQKRPLSMSQKINFIHLMVHCFPMNA